MGVKFKPLKAASGSQEDCAELRNALEAKIGNLDSTLAENEKSIEKLANSVAYAVNKL